MKSNFHKPKHTQRCVVCRQPFNRMEAVCWRCASCQACKQITNDKMGNYCIHCQNNISQPRYNQAAIIMHIHHKPNKPFRGHTFDIN